MKRKSRAAHVTKISRKYKNKTYDSFLVRQSYREDGKVKHRTLANLTHLPRPVIELVRRALQGERFTAVDEAFEILRSRPHGHVAAVLGTLRKIGLERIIAGRSSRARALVVAMIVARVLDPRSKLATAQSLHPETLHNTLGECLGVEAADEDELYDAMDWLAERQPKIEKALAKKHLEEATLVLCDLTSTYFEGRKCPLAKRGYSRDGKKNRLQIVFGLLANREGCPIAVEVFAGNTNDAKTVKDQVEKLRKRFGLERIVLVGDRGMLTSARLEEDLKPHDLQWITALRAPQIRGLIEAGAIQLSLFDERDLVEVKHPDFSEERLVVCRNPLLAEERGRKREELLVATERELEKIVSAVKRDRRPLRGEGEIGIRVGKVIGKYKVGKHFKMEIGDDFFRFERDTEKIEAEALQDGLYVIRTNVSKEDLPPEEAVRIYKSLSAVEKAFRALKTVDLKVRPIYHRLEKRVRAHVFLCMLAYYVEWHLRQALAPLLFHDEDPAGAEAARSSIVAPAKRSPSALRKIHTGHNADALPVRSFQGLLRDLGTLCKNRVILKGSGQGEANPPFDLLTLPTPIQEEAFRLLGVSAGGV